jgi:phosphoglycolate phosphatase-like HAD superfamily hydrolase
VTQPGGADFVPVPARVAVFDNDGTLWCEKPMPIQLDFTVRRLAEMATNDVDLRRRQPWQAAYEQDLHWFGAAMVKHYHGDDEDLGLLMGGITQAFADVTIDEYSARVLEFFDDVDHPTLGVSYAACSFKPMVDLLRYLEANDFTTYIASGGDRDFMRPVAEGLYSVPPERVIGSAVGLTYRDDRGGPELLYAAAMDYFDDGPEKPIRIWSRIGRRPILAAGNSNGDIPMLDYTGSGPTPSLRMLIRHDDGDREFAYDAGSEDALARAAAEDWTVVSMRDDWTCVLSDPPPVS